MAVIILRYFTALGSFGRQLYVEPVKGKHILSATEMQPKESNRSEDINDDILRHYRD